MARRTFPLPAARPSYITERQWSVVNALDHNPRTWKSVERELGLSYDTVRTAFARAERLLRIHADDCPYCNGTGKRLP